MTDEELQQESAEVEQYHAHQALQYAISVFGVPGILRLIADEMTRPADLDDNVPF